MYIFNINKSQIINFKGIDKKKQVHISPLIDYIFENYIVDVNLNEANDNVLKKFIEALSLINIISAFNHTCLDTYLEVLSDYLNIGIQNKIILDNRVKQIICLILKNVFDHTDYKNVYFINLEKYLLFIIITKPNFVMISALE